MTFDLSNKDYFFEDVSWWDSNGCSCCEDVLMQAYKCERTAAYGTATSVEHCYRQALYHQGILEDDDDSVHDLSFHDLVHLATINEINVMIEESQDDC